ncbi:MAG: VWA-like domain-containing protein [Candidatus Competibacteraceae bacterium]
MYRLAPSRRTGAQIRLQLEPRIPTAGIFASGRLVVNPDFAHTLKPDELSFVLAHELMHLALDTHGRGGGSNPAAVNIAHDYIINDMLREALGQPPPAGGLSWYEARHTALEELLAHYRQFAHLGWQTWQRPQLSLGLLGQALTEAGLGKTAENDPEQPGETERGLLELDVLTAAQERDWYPDAPQEDSERRSAIIRVTAAKSNSLHVMLEALEKQGIKDRGVGNGAGSAELSALKSAYQPPWELALQHWLDAQAPGERSFARPSRRGADRTDVVLPGRKRQGWALHIVLDTSGSMVADLPAVLGIIAAFCENAGVNNVHILQCDTEVTVDEWIEPGALAAYEIQGYGGSNMTPALHRLAEDAEVEAAVVITDGCIDYPAAPMPYALLWAVIHAGYDDFRPGYGQIVYIPRELLSD